MTNQNPADKPSEFRMGELWDLLNLYVHPARMDGKEKIKELVEAAQAQARRDTFDLVRDVMFDPQFDDRREFLDYCLTGALEGHTFWFQRVRYDIGSDAKPTYDGYRPPSATIIESGEDYLDREKVTHILETNDDPDHPCFEVTQETIEKGLTLIRNATNIPDTGTGNWEKALTSVPNLGQGQRNEIIRADLTNDAGLLDADGYGAILEVALFGEVRYC